MSSILVTGGAGYIGSHTCKALRTLGFVPVTYDNLERGNREAVKWGVIEIGDLADTARLREVFTRHRPEAVIHFAAFAYVGEFEPKSSCLLPQQRRRHCGVARCHARSRHPTHSVFQHLCGIRKSRSSSNYREKSASADQSLRG